MGRSLWKGRATTTTTTTTTTATTSTTDEGRAAEPAVERRRQRQQPKPAAEQARLSPSHLARDTPVVHSWSDDLFDFDDDGVGGGGGVFTKGKEESDMRLEELLAEMGEEKSEKAMTTTTTTTSGGRGSNFDLVPMRFSGDADDDFGAGGGIDDGSKILARSDGAVQRGVGRKTQSSSERPEPEMFNFANFDDAESFNDPSSDGSGSEEKTKEPKEVRATGPSSSSRPPHPKDRENSGRGFMEARPLLFDAEGGGGGLSSRGSSSINGSMNGNETDADVSAAASELGILSVGESHTTVPITNFAPGKFIERERKRRMERDLERDKESKRVDSLERALENRNSRALAKQEWGKREKKEKKKKHTERRDRGSDDESRSSRKVCYLLDLPSSC